MGRGLGGVLALASIVKWITDWHGGHPPVSGNN